MPYEQETGISFFDMLDRHLERLAEMQTEWSLKQLELFHISMMKELERVDSPGYTIGVNPTWTVPDVSILKSSP